MSISSLGFSFCMAPTITNRFHGNLFPISLLPKSQIRVSRVFSREKDCNSGSRKEGRKGRLVLVRANNNNRGFNFNPNNGGNGRLIGNLAVALGLTYLSATGQLGWLLDAIVSVWILAVVLPIVGIAAFFYFASRDIVQSSCPNCGNDFQIFKSSMSDTPQLCPFCRQPFSVKNDQFVREPAIFSSEKSSGFAHTVSGQERRTSASGTIVDVEAHVKDAELDPTNNLQ